MSVVVAIFLLAIILMIAISLGLLYVGPILLLQPHRRRVDYYRRRTGLLHPKDADLPFAEITLRTSEGFRLSCWFVRAAGPARGTVIYLHGVNECKIVGLPIAQVLHRHNFHVFLYDSRRHGDSEGDFCTYGFYEKHDVSTIIDFLQERGDLQTGACGLFGNSMGAAVALQAAAMDDRVRAIVAESGFASLRTVFDDYQKRMTKLPWHYLRNLVIKRSERLAHFRANAVSPLEAVRHIRVPVFIMHGTRDDKISSLYSQMVFTNASGPKELWLVQGARHDDVFDIGGREYIEKVTGFFTRYLSPTVKPGHAVSSVLTE